MKLFDVYQQRPPVAVKSHRLTAEGKPMVEWEANLIHVGQVRAENGNDAIDKAREMLAAFRVASRRTLAGFPIVSPASA